MEGEDETSRQSSLPSSLIPHLYTRPQQLGDMLSGSGGTFRPQPRPSSPVTRGEARISDESVGPPSTMALVATTSPPFVQARSSPRDYSPYGPMDPNMNRRSTGMTASVNFPMPGVRRAVDAQAMLTRGQRYNNPIYSDPSYHVSRPFIPYRGPGYAPPPYTQRGATWQEGEPGPSTETHEGASRTHIVPHQVGQPPEVFNRQGWNGEDLEAFQRSEVVQPRPSMMMPSARTYMARGMYISKNTTSRVLRSSGIQAATATDVVPRGGGRLFGYIWKATRGICSSAEAYISISGGKVGTKRRKGKRRSRERGEPASGRK